MQTKKPVAAAQANAEILPSQVAAILPGVVYQIHCEPDGSSYFTFVNEASRSLLGLEPEEMLKDLQSYRKRIHPEDLPGMLATIAIHNQSLKPWSRQFRFVIPNRGLKWIQSTAHLEKLPEGGVQWTGFLTDITPTKRAEEALQLSQKRFAEAWKSSRVGMAYVSLSGSWTDVNGAMCEFLGLSEAELLATDFQTLTHPDDLASDLNLVDQLLAGEISDYSLEKRYRRADRQFVWGYLTVVLIRDSEGQPLHFLSQVQDIDQRKRAEENLRVSEERINLAAQAGQVGMWDYNFETREIIWNDAQFTIHGVTQGEYLPNVDENLRFVHPEDREWVNDAFDHCIQSGRNHYEVECRIIRADGEVRTTRSNALIFRDPRGLPLRAVGTEVDITEQRQLMETLANARQAAEAATRAKSEFLARMSHEIRTPLNAIMAPGHLLAASELTDSQDELIAMIIAAGDHLLLVINDILDFSKLEAGKMRVTTENFSMLTLADEVRSLMSILAERKGLTFGTTIEPDVEGEWFGDAGRIKQVLINLVSNAIKYSGSGEVTLRISLDEPGEKIPTVRFEVRDMGFGLSSSQQSKLFQPFEQIGHRDWESGTGLGLAICRDLVELLGGTIGCVSDTGQGSLFWFTIPLQPDGTRPTRKVGKNTTERTAAQKSRILVVEDNPSNRRVVSLLLRRMGHTILFAVNGQQAVEKIAEEKFDLVLMDCEMPIMDGLDATREIRKQGQNLPIVAITAHVSADHRRACLEAGMDDLLPKPLIVEDLTSMLDRWLAHP